MVKLRVSSIMLAGGAAVLLAGCDTGEPDAVQAALEAKLAPDVALTGTLDRSSAGDPIPAVTLTDPSGTQLDLAQATGTPILLNLWATWCAPCVVEMPLLDALAADLAGSVRVLTVSEDLRGAEVVEPFFAERDLANLPRWMDQDNSLALSFGGGAVLPLTILYDAQGEEVWRVIGGYDWASAEAREMVLEGLDQQPLAGM